MRRTAWAVAVATCVGFTAAATATATAAAAAAGAGSGSDAGKEGTASARADGSGPRGGYGTRTPVLLVPGWFDTERDLAALRIRLISAGWPVDHVRAVSFHERTGSNRIHAEEIDSAARALLEAAGADELDIVAHSMGGLATRWFLRRPDAPRVRRAVFVASPHRGTYAAYVAWGEGGEEMKPGSAFLDTLAMGPPVPADVEAMTIRTPVDTHILPGESATLPGIPDEAVCCPTHAGLIRSLEVFRIIRRFLDLGDA